jgi:hypothetical protein
MQLKFNGGLSDEMMTAKARREGEMGKNKSSRKKIMKQLSTHLSAGINRPKKRKHTLQVMALS